MQVVLQLLAVQDCFKDARVPWQMGSNQLAVFVQSLFQQVWRCRADKLQQQGLKPTSREARHSTALSRLRLCPLILL